MPVESRIRVLLVAADAARRRAQAALLDAMPGVQVVGSASCAAEAMREVPRRKPELVVMDLFMPRMSGLQAAAEIKLQPAAPRVVLVSLGEGPAYADAGREFRADGVVRREDLPTALPPILRRLFPDRSGRG